MLALLAVLPTIVLMAFTVRERRAADEATHQRDTLQLARHVAAKQQQFIEGARQLLIALAQLPAVRDGDYDACNELFAELIGRYGIYANLGLADVNGDVQCSGLPSVSGVNIGDRAYFQRAVSEQNFAVGDYQVGRITGLPSLNFGYPVFDNAGRWRGVVYAALDLTWMSAYATELDLPPGAAFIVIDRLGTILARYPEPQAWVGKLVPDAAVLKAMQGSSEGVVEAVGVDGIARLFAFTQLAPANESGAVYVSIGIPNNVVFANANRLLVINLVLLVLAFVVSMSLARFVGDRLIQQPLRGLLRITRLVSGGDLSARAAPALAHMPTEYAELGTALDDMLTSLNRLTEERRGALERLEQESRYMQLLGAVAATANLADSIQQPLQTCVDAVCRLTGWPIGHVLMRSEGEPPEMTSTTHWHVADANHYAKFVEVTNNLSFAAGIGMPGRIMSAGEPVWIQDIGQASNLIRADLSERLGLRTACGFPVLVGSETAAVVEFFIDRPTPPDSRLMEVMGQVGIQLGRAIERQRAQQRIIQFNADLERRVQHRTVELEQRSQELALLGELGQLLSLCNTPGEAFEIAGPYARRLFPHLSGAVFVMNASRNSLEARAVWGHQPPDPVITPDSCWALRQGQPHIVPIPAQSPMCAHVIASGQGNNPYLCVPLAAQGEVLGVLHLHCQGIADETCALENIRQLAETLAKHTALALANLNLRDTLRAQSIRDPLTNLFNRRYMEETLERELHRATRKGAPLGVVMIDVDHFKQFNDRHGHDAGDEYLRELAQLFLSKVRNDDVVCRFGGEEFLMILPDADLPSVLARAEEIRSKAQSMAVVFHQQPLPALTLSIGAAVYPHHGDAPQQVVRAADQALYKAKRNGRNQIVVSE